MKTRKEIELELALYSSQMQVLQKESELIRLGAIGLESKIKNAKDELIEFDNKK
ncbi:hypothetical protein [Rouxiella sp. WC2420]|uniref:Phage protein n=1 Tax=Rouxiella sp. WC2420 TaxID=3234145 RepID=A0AB39VNH2_9GAMM